MINTFKIQMSNKKILMKYTICILFTVVFSSYIRLSASYKHVKYVHYDELMKRYNPNVFPRKLRPPELHTASLIFLHGVDDTGDGVLPYLKDYQLPYMKIICPTAKLTPVSLHNGSRIFAWYDIKKTSHKIEDTSGIRKVTPYIHHLIEDEMGSYGIMSHRIILGGFGQGGALALHVGLTYPKQLGGIIAFSTWLPKRTTFCNEAINPANMNTSVLRCDDKYEADNSSIPRGFKYKSYTGKESPVSKKDYITIKQFCEQKVGPVVTYETYEE